ncbi:MAG: phytanoyl-CoA dioxygenase family protein [Gemmatimonadetes bacterium]|nr:phytanoyl-CoA dioxygenase family protein [Gemmatimonadota bacterium]
MGKAPDEALSSFAENGFLLVESVFAAEEMAVCKTEAKELVENQSGPSGVHVWMCDAIPPRFESISCDSRMTAILRPLIGPRIEFLSAKPVFKSPTVHFASPWHQDQAYWGGATKYSAWIALEDATPENGCLRVIPGSHRQARDHASVRDARGFANRVSDDDLKGEPMMDVKMKCGDVLVFHDRLLHSSHPNRSGRDRWCFIPTYRNADVPDASTVWATAKLIDEAV